MEKLNILISMTNVLIRFKFNSISLSVKELTCNQSQMIFVFIPRIGS